MSCRSLANLAFLSALLLGGSAATRAPRSSGTWRDQVLLPSKNADNWLNCCGDWTAHRLQRPKVNKVAKCLLSTFSTSQLPKVVRAWCVLYILTWTCASRRNRVHFFDICTSKNGLRMVCFVHFDVEMCFVPQRRALFRHLNFQKWSENGVFCTFWLGNVLRATTACTFSTSQLPKVVWDRSLLTLLTWKCATARNYSSLIGPAGSAPAAFARLLFDPPEPQIIGKTQWIATFLPFRPPASSCF